MLDAELLAAVYVELTTQRQAALQLELIMLAPIIQKLNRNELVPFVGDERLTFDRTPHEAQVTVQVGVPA